MTTGKDDGRGRRPQTKSLDEPDEVITLEDTLAQTVQVGDLTIGRLVAQPGWRWSTHVRPTVGTESCQYHHVGVGISGSARFLMDDGTEIEVRPGDVFDIPPGHDNWVTSDEPAVAIMWGGWRGWGKPPDGERVLMSLVMTDIEDSTKRLAAVGDAAWDRLLERHHATTLEIADRYRGREVDRTGDGFLLAFDGAARAVHAAVDIGQSAAAIGLQVRVGVHTGEVEVVPGGLRGVTVHETARIMALGRGGEVLLSDITRALSQGAPVGYEDRGVHELKGIPAPRHVFAVV